MKYGVSITEKVFDIINNKTEWNGLIALDRLITRPPHTFTIVVNKQGTIIELFQQTDTQENSLTIEKFIFYRNGFQFSNPYGQSELKQAYRWAFIKDRFVKYMGIYGEKFSVPYALGKVPPQTSQSDREMFQEMLERIQAKGSGVIDDDSLIEFLNAGQVGSYGDFFNKAIELFNKAIARNFLIPELFGFTDHETGSQSLGKEQLDLYIKTAVLPQQKKLSDMISEEIIRPLIDLNFGEQNIYPTIVFSDLLNQDLKEKYDIWFAAIKGGIIEPTEQDNNILRKDLNFPEVQEEDEEPIEDDPVEDEPIPEDDELPVDDEEDAVPLPDVEDEPIQDKTPEGQPVEFKADPVFFSSQNVNQVQNDFDTLETAFGTSLNTIITEIKDFFINETIEQKIVANEDFAAVRRLKIPKTSVDKLRKSFETAALSGKDTGFDTSIATLEESLNTKLQLEIDFANKGTVGTFTPSKTSQFLKNNAFIMSGIEDDFILKEVQLTLQSGLLAGKSTSQIVSDLEDVFTTYGLFTVGFFPKEGLTGRLLTVTRTNLSTAYNLGRMESFNDPGVKEDLAALQYSAIIDTNTTDFCLTYDNRVYKATDSLWDWLTPPNHFNCRSIVFPVFIQDDPTISTKIAKRPPTDFGG